MPAMPITEHRSFLLSLGPEVGHQLAASVGYLSPGPDVLEREMRQVYKEWAQLDAEGILHRVAQYAKWFTEASCEDDATPEQRSLMMSSLMAFGVSMLSRLKNTGCVDTGSKIRVLAVDEDGNPYPDSEIPEELAALAAEMNEYKRGPSS